MTVVQGLRFACFIVTKRPEIAEQACAPDELDFFVFSTTVVRRLRFACAFVTKRPLIAESSSCSRSASGAPVAMSASYWWWLPRGTPVVAHELTC
jgi:hypothetical protein